MKYKCYLAGPITGCSFDNAIDWRDKVIEQLAPDIEGLSPLRGKKYLAGVQKIGDSYEEIPLSCSRGIFTRDFYDVRRSDIMLVNFLNTDRISIGTVMEIAWGRAFEKPIIAVMEKLNNLHDHSMIRECVGFRVDRLEDAVEIAKVLVLPAPHK